MRRAGYPMLDEYASTLKEKENMQALYAADLSGSSDGKELCLTTALFSG